MIQSELEASRTVRLVPFVRLASTWASAPADARRRSTSAATTALVTVFAPEFVPPVPVPPVLVPPSEEAEEEESCEDDAGEEDEDCWEDGAREDGVCEEEGFEETVESDPETLRYCRLHQPSFPPEVLTLTHFELELSSTVSVTPLERV